MGKGYCITYEGAERYPTPGKKKFRVTGGTGLFVVVIALTISLAVPKIKEPLISFIIPGNDQVTIQATEELVSCLQGGENTAEALEAFCRMILNNGT